MAVTQPAVASFKFGAGQLEPVHYAEHVSVSIAGHRGMLTANLPDADIPAKGECLLLSLRTGALGPMEGKMNFSRMYLRTAKSGTEFPLRSKASESNVLSAASHDDGLNLGRHIQRRAPVETPPPERHSISPGARLGKYRDKQPLFMALRCLEA